MIYKYNFKIIYLQICQILVCTHLINITIFNTISLLTSNFWKNLQEIVLNTKIFIKISINKPVTTNVKLKNAL